MTIMGSKARRGFTRIGIAAIVVIAVGAAFVSVMPLIKKELLRHRIEHEIANDPRSHIGILSNICTFGNPDDALQVLWDLALDATSTANEKDQAGYAISMLAIGHCGLSSGPLVSPDSPSSKLFTRFMENKLNSSSDQEKELASRVLELREKYLTTKEADLFPLKR
jgi:hypothetical protein